MELNQEIQKNLFCTYCHQVVSYGPVLLSSQGKNVCGRCRAPKKPEHEIFLRNVLFEEIAKAHTFHCKNKELGCTAVLKTEVLRLHEAVCTFNTHGCPTQALDNKCPWTGQLEHIEDHYRSKHSELIIEHPLCERPNIQRNYVQNFLLTYLGFAFLLQKKCDVGRSTIWHNVVFLGPPHLASLFRYTIKLEKDFDCIIKNKPVQPYGRFVMYESDSIKQRINNIFQDLGDYDEIDFQLSVTMKAVKCTICGAVLDRAPIHYTGEGDHCCLRCYMAPEEATGTDVRDSPSQTEPLQTADTHTQTDDKPVRDEAAGNIVKEYKTQQCQTYAVRFMECRGCGGELSEADQGNTCQWCLVLARLNQTTSTTGGHECVNKGRGCTYRHSNWWMARRHRLYFCTYEDGCCEVCGKKHLGTRAIDHLVQRHSTEVPAVVHGGEAIAQITSPPITNWSRYVIRVRGLMLHLEISRSINEIELMVWSTTELRGRDHLDINCIVSSPTTSTTVTQGLHYNDRNTFDWYQNIKLTDLKLILNPKIDIKLIVSIK